MNLEALNLSRCPCGEIPKRLIITDNEYETKWAKVCGNCCGDWIVEFKLDSHHIESNLDMELAIQAWNDAPRARTLG